MATTPVLLPREFHAQRSLAGCSLKGHRESDMAEHSGIHAMGSVEKNVKLKAPLVWNP